MQNQYLYHYGVKGMRWGVRRERRKASKQLYRDVKEAASNPDYYTGRHTFRNKHRKELKDSEKKSSEIWFKALDGTLDYSKGSPDWQSRQQLATQRGRELLGKYANRKISTSRNHKLSASDYVASIIDEMGKNRAADLIEIKEGRKPKLTDKQDRT